MKKAILFSYLFIVFNVKAQVPVSKEPRHHVVFANEKVRLLNVLLPSGDTTQYHEHSTPSVFICFTKTHTISQLIHQQPIESISKAGDIWFENLKPPHTKIHRVWNKDTDTYHVMDIEILSKDSVFDQKPLVLPHAQLTIDTAWTRTYKIELVKSAQVAVKEHSSAFVLVAIDDGMINMIKKGAGQNVSLHPGTFFWIKPGEQLSLLNPSATVIRFALVEVR